MSEQVYFFKKSSIADSRAEVVEERAYEPIFCPVYAGHRSSWRLPGPIRIDLEESDSTECLWTFMSDCLLNETIIEEFHKHDFTGFETDVVETSKPNPLGFRYLQFHPTGWGGVAPLTSGIELTYFCEHCLHKKYSPLKRPDQLFSSLQWDGSDFFVIWPMPAYIFVTQRVADVIYKIGVTGLDLVPIEELKMRGYGFAPGRLSYYLPYERAMEIGRPLRID